MSHKVAKKRNYAKLRRCAECRQPLHGDFVKKRVQQGSTHKHVELRFCPTCSRRHDRTPERSFSRQQIPVRRCPRKEKVFPT